MSSNTSPSEFLSLPLLSSQGRPPMPQSAKRKRNRPGNPDPSADVVALSPKTLMATNRFLCEICGKGFQRDQNLQLHLRGHNLPWKLKQRDNSEIVKKKKKVYVCPEATCAHHDPSRALGDLTGIKKHFWRKHGEKRWACEKCSKKYAVMSDWKAHVKICGTREYKCSCGTIFARKDSYGAHRAFCEALAEESAKFNQLPISNSNLNPNPNPNFQTGAAPIFWGPFFSAGALQWQREESQLTRDFLGVIRESEPDLLSMIEDGGLDGVGNFMVSAPTSFTSATTAAWWGLRN